MKEIKLTQGKVALVDDEDYDYLMQWKWYLRKDDIRKYAIAHKRKPYSYNETVFMHTLIMNPAKGYETDHIDGNGLNNQKYNLRNVTHQQNTMNKRSKKPYKGVYLRKNGNYTSQIRVNGKVYYLGSCKTIEQAAKRYDLAAAYYYEEYCRLNF